MTAEDLFGLIVRIGGAAAIVVALLTFLCVLVRLAGVPVPARYAIAVDFFFAVIYLVLGLVLFLAADPITRLAYRKRRNPN